ncbi:microfibril-associated glycoprotein 4-like [Clytia hemisphaerica]|uniref:Fibrinogen C-terminal domain-containing protein n=1 Tax=Clytia hemisphaerica TaxID=252671 RepID=A0A7M5V980_9CNID
MHIMWLLVHPLLILNLLKGSFGKSLDLIGKHKKTTLIPYHTIQTPKLQQCFSICHYSKKCRVMETTQTNSFNCKFFDVTLQASDITGPDLNTNIYAETRNCQDLYNIGVRASGDYHLNLFGDGYEYLLFCHFDADGGWIVIQRHIDNEFSFHRQWDVYKEGFGDSKGSFWLGLELIHKITRDQSQQVKIEALSFSGDSAMAKYGAFSVASEDKNYLLSVDGFDAIASNNMDILKYSIGMEFSTLERDNDNYQHNCANGWNSRGGWWYDTCGDFMPNAQWYPEEQAYKPVGDGWKGMRYGPITESWTLKSTLILLKPKDN